MAKFMLSLRDENFKILISEAQDRGITIQELIRAVIIPDWVKDKTLVRIAETAASSLRSFAGANNSNSREPMLQSVGRYRS